MLGGRSTYGECFGVLTWQIDDGHAGECRLDGLKVALATRYHDDEPGSPWSHVVYVDDSATVEQHDALEHFPWAWKESRLLGVRRAAIDVSHEPRRQWLRIRDQAAVVIRGRWAGPEVVTCVIPGHDEPGEELVADELRVDDELLQFSFAGNCGYAAGFDYRG